MNWLFFVFILAIPQLSAAQNGKPAVTRDLSEFSERPRVRAERLAQEEHISIDGRLDEPAWQTALPAKDFLQQDPNFGQPATEKTEVRFLFSRDTLYMGVTNYDSEPDKLRGNTMLRDAGLNADDRFMWTFDTYLDNRSGYYFEMNPSGSMADALLTPENTNNNAARAWNGIWNARVRKSEIGWTIEIAIPFRTLNFDPDSPAWGVNFQRTVRRKNEESLWTGHARNQGLRRMSNAGLLEGISDVSQGRGLDIQPYATGTYRSSPGTGVPSKFEKDAGIDFTYSITPQLKGNVTLNTDFAETEVDQRQVNLTRFPLFFPEQRGFFLEGTTFFDFAREQGNSITPFFSRRIGLNNGQPQRVEYGTKLTGQIGANDVGLMQVRTAASDGMIGEDFTILRTKRRFWRQSYIGGMYTRRTERDTGAPGLTTMAADFELATNRFRGRQNLNMSGYYLVTSGPGPVSDRLAQGIRVEYPNDVWQVRFALRDVHPNYKPAVGYVDRVGIRRYNPEMQFSPRPSGSSLVRRYNFKIDYEFITDMQNRMVTRTMDNTVFQAELQAGDNFQVHVVPTYEFIEKDFALSDGITLPKGNSYNFTRFKVQWQTANQRVVSNHVEYEVGNFYSGKRREFIVNFGIRPRAGVLIQIQNQWNRIELPEGNFSTHLMRMNANTQFNPWISVANNVQYDTVSGVLGWQSRLRWIVRPGNDIYVVYTHNWINNLAGGRSTYDRSAATKIMYTYRF